MSRPTWTGRRVTTALHQLLTTQGDQCWLCHHPGANSLDHITPTTTAPHLEWEPTNWAPAHLARAGNPKGCPTPQCTCPGNTGRQDTPHTATPSRKW